MGGFTATPGTGNLLPVLRQARGIRSMLRLTKWYLDFAAAMGLDVPGSNRRFSRLAAADWPPLLLVLEPRGGERRDLSGQP